MFILAQILSFLAMLINMIAVQLKTKKRILLAIVGSNLLFVISYLLLRAYVGALASGIVAIEIIMNTILEESPKYNSKRFIVIYLIIPVVLGIITLKNWVDVLPILAAILSILIFIQSKERYVRLLILGNLISWIFYDFTVRAYLAEISDFFVILSTIIAIYRYDIKKYD